jgi:formiminotetrahydrofolate cyclodeaminase
VSASEFVKKMEDQLGRANRADDIERSAYFGHAAICYGILAILAEMKSLRDTIEELQAKQTAES